MAASGNETEIKLRLPSPEAARERLAGAGFVVTRPRVFEVSLLLDDAAGTLYSKGEALRVREQGGETILTYKGPVAIGRHKSREEIETSAGEAAALLAILTRIGFAPVWRYEKFRAEFGRPGEAGVATLDETPIGTFIELEGDGHWIDQAASQLGFSEKDYVNDSYAAIFRRHCQATGQAMKDGMVFDERLRENLMAATARQTKDT